MNQQHRDRIDSCCEDIVPRTNLAALWPKLLENKVFNRDDVNVPEWTRDFASTDTARDVYLTIKTRGPLAFELLLLSLRQSGHESLADLLEGRRTSHQNDNTIQPSFNGGRINTKKEREDSRKHTWVVDPKGDGDTFFHKIQNSKDPLKVQVRKATEFLDGPVCKSVQRYPMRSKPHGLVLIITNIDYKYSNDPPRNSAQHDERNLTLLFEQMGFEVVSELNLTGEAMMRKITEFSRREDLRRVDSAFVIISGHGNTNAENEVTEIQGVDYPAGNTVLCTDVTDCFNAERCPHLAEKPKVFIFQVCRGDKRQKAANAPRHVTDISTFTAPEVEEVDTRVVKKVSVRNYADMLIAHATMPGHAAFRDKYTGSWFIQILCEVFMNYACTTHLQDLLSMVDERLNTVRTTKEECQTLVITSIGFNKHCYLQPGLFE